MELLMILIGGTSVVAAAATVRALLTDGRGHTPDVRSTAPWTAGDLPSQPYSEA
jgi:hypothetical protein